MENSLTEHFKTPGQLIASLLEDRQWTQKVLAAVLDADETGINKIIAGKRAVDAKMALALGELFEVPAEDFLLLQKKYELEQAKIVMRPDPIRNLKANIYGALPIPEMIKRGWLNVDNMKNFPKLEKELLRFFKVNSLDEIKEIPHAAKKTNANESATPTQLAWLYRAKEIANDILVPEYSVEALKCSLPKLKELLVSEIAIRKVNRILFEAGVRFVVIESLKSAKIDGACFWLNDRSPVIAMSLRFDRIDNFWFVLRHEIEHILQGHGKVDFPILDIDIFEDGSNSNISQEEVIANNAAANFCVPQKLLADFIIRKAPFFYDKDIIGFARTIRVHPGLVAGQLRHKLNIYNRFSNHLSKVRSIIINSGVTIDGWGNIVPLEQY